MQVLTYPLGHVPTYTHTNLHMYNMCTRTYTHTQRCRWFRLCCSSGLRYWSSFTVLFLFLKFRASCSSVLCTLQTVFPVPCLLPSNCSACLGVHNQVLKAIRSARCLMHFTPCVPSILGLPPRDCSEVFITNSLF